MTQENIKLKQMDDALELAYLLYDIFKESQNENGQNNADQTRDD